MARNATDGTAEAAFLAAEHGPTSVTTPRRRARSRSRVLFQRAARGEELCRLLEARGFVRLRQRGSHVILQRRTAGRSLTLPVPMHREWKVGTLLSIVRQSGLPRSLFESE